jgi:Right handed beta helix region
MLTPTPRPRERAALLLCAALATLATTACNEHEYVSPTTPQGAPPAYASPAGPADAPPPPPPAAPSAPIPDKPEPLTFFRTQDSNEWVEKNIKVQASYTRVIAVTKAEKAPATVTVGKLDLNAPPGPEATVELAVTLTVHTLAEAAAEAKGGDLVAVLPGHYQGFSLGDKPDAGDGRYIHFKALGAPGEVVIDGPCSEDKNWMIYLAGAHHVIVQGFNVAGSNPAGTTEPTGPNAGIFVSGDFLRTSKLAHHVAIVGNFVHEHKKWGLHSVDSHTVLVQDNLFATSAKEHGAYVSDGSDDYVIRRNVFFGSSSSGLQVNVDPLASLEKTSKHPALEVGEMKPTRAWALAVLKAATDRFGANNFPDGRGFNFIIESNVMNENGRSGGAALNLAGVRESLIQNNLMYDNQASGIAEWDNANPFDAASVDPGPKTPADVTGVDVFPLFGCYNNLIRDNTVLGARKGRPALAVGNGSWGTRAYNNVLINDEFPSIELVATSIWRFEGAYNVLDRVNYEESAAALKSLATILPDGPDSFVGISRRALGPSFVSASNEPWVVFEGSWWKLNPKRPDFHPRPASPVLSGKGDPRNMPKQDLEGKTRAKADIGAYAAAVK